MHYQTTLFALGAVVPLLASAWPAADKSGFHKKWEATFDGPAGSMPDPNLWNVIQGDIGVNNEQQVYGTSGLQRSGGKTVQFMPQQKGGQWTSGRIESKFVFTPADGKTTIAESMIRFGTGNKDSKKGMWPAFWLLGDSIRHGTSWPQCGELDVMETVNGELKAHGTIHCDKSPGGICNEGQGIGNSINLPNVDWHQWQLKWDRAPGRFEDETITWYMDGVEFHKINGQRVGKQVWDTLAAKPLFFILNMAVGGDWPGKTSITTVGGANSMMEVAYVTLFESN